MGQPIPSHPRIGLGANISRDITSHSYKFDPNPAKSRL